MTWRSIMISNPARLNSEQGALVIEQQQKVRVPLEDIATIVLNHREISVTHGLLSVLADYGIGLFTLGQNHHPNGILLPFLSHSRAVRMQRFQLALDKPTTKQLWANLVTAKITNQTICLEKQTGEAHPRLHSLIRRIKSGDKENLEAQASAYYFPKLYGKAFHRNQDIWFNAGLDYGYAILRGAIARSLVTHGFLPSIGIFHCSEQNAFNLADDIIEPFRALVDLHVVREASNHDESDQLKPADKSLLVGLLNVDWQMPQGKMNTLSAIEYCIESLARACEYRNSELLQTPILLGLEQHQVEGSEP